MHCVGNDIVDLKTPHALMKSRDLRFVRRICTTNEQTLVKKAAHQDRMLWSLWAAKEASFKAMLKRNPCISSIPRQHSITLLNPEMLGDKKRVRCWGFADTPGTHIRIMIEAGSEFVHCIGISDGNVFRQNIRACVEKVRVDNINDPLSSKHVESAAVRTAVRAEIAQHENCRPSDITIIRSPHRRGLGPPSVFVRGHKSNTDISMSHDGRFIAYAILFSREPNLPERQPDAEPATVWQCECGLHTINILQKQYIRIQRGTTIPDCQDRTYSNFIEQ